MRSALCASLPVSLSPPLPCPSTRSSLPPPWPYRLTLGVACRKKVLRVKAGVVKLVDARDSKSRGPLVHEGSTPSPGTISHSANRSSSTHFPSRAFPPGREPGGLRRVGVYAAPALPAGAGAGRVDPPHPASGPGPTPPQCRRHPHILPAALRDPDPLGVHRALAHPGRARPPQDPHPGAAAAARAARRAAQPAPPRKGPARPRTGASSASLPRGVVLEGTPVGSLSSPRTPASIPSGWAAPLTEWRPMRSEER